ncbi:MAG: protein phosphatase 2C domain-containing protein [Anaerolineales bacterium]|nr:protein phosphatase 2C domain-containing protein [Anaerolineales bacterium]
MTTGFVIGDRGLGTSGDTHPAWMLGHAVAGDYLVVGASAIGQIHLAHGALRDDAFLVRTSGPWIAVAVADGVGSKTLSRYGATYVVEALTSLLLRQLSPPLSASDELRKEESFVISNNSPPASVGEVKLCTEAYQNITGQEFTDGLEEWRAKIGVDSFDLEMELTQAASIGWWPSIQAKHPESSALVSQQESSIDNKAHPSKQIGSDADVDAPTLNLLTIMDEAFQNTHLGLRDHANRLELELTELSCTALGLLLNVETGTGVIAQIGDGAILGLTAQGQVIGLIEAPDTGDPQATYTLNKPNFKTHLAISPIEAPKNDPIVAFYVMTDGLSGDLLYSPDPDSLRHWSQKVDHNLRYAASPAQAAAGMLNWLASYVVSGSWDDRTLVVITRQERAHGNCQAGAEQPEPA